MPISTLDINSITDLGTPVAINGAIRATEIGVDDVFEYIIAVAILIYEVHP